MTTHVRRPAGADRFATEIDWLDSKHSFSFGQHYDPANTHFGLLLVSNDDVVAPGTRLRDAPAPRHGDRHVGARRRPRPPGLAGPQRRHLPRARPADERRHAGSCTARRTTPGGSTAARRATTRCTSCRCGCCPTRRGIEPGYEQLDIGAELARGGLVPRRLGHGRARATTRRSGSSSATPRCSPPGSAPGESVALPAAPYVHLYVARGAVDLEGAGRAGHRRRRTAHGRRRASASPPPTARRGPRLGDAPGPRLDPPPLS